MGKNRRYSSYSSARRRNPKKRENPLLTGAAVVFSVLVAALCGRTLDARYATVTAASGPQSPLDEAQLGQESSRAALRLTSPEDAERRSRVESATAAIEKLSGVIGSSPLLSDTWVAETPLILNDVDVSGMLAQELTLKRSLLSGYSPTVITMAPRLERAGAFFDLLLKDEKGAAQIIRMEKGAVSVVYRSPSGYESQRSQVPLPATSECGAVVLDLTTGSSELRCQSKTTEGSLVESVLVGIAPLPVKGRTVSVATNLVKNELPQFSVKADLRGTEVEDKI